MDYVVSDNVTVCKQIIFGAKCFGAKTFRIYTFNIVVYSQY
jgi:hypothetical protein